MTNLEKAREILYKAARFHFDCDGDFPLNEHLEALDKACGLSEALDALTSSKSAQQLLVESVHWPADEELAKAGWYHMHAMSGDPDATWEEIPEWQRDEFRLFVEGLKQRCGRVGEEG